MDVLSSGPAGPRGSRAERFLRSAGRRVGLVRPGPAQGRNRRLAAVLAALAAVVVLAALRSGAEPVGAPAAESEVAEVPTPPFDRMPGRVPIPAPTHAGWFVHGSLQSTGPPGRDSAQRAALLVLGRYCARPDRYTLTFAPQQAWRSVDVLAFGLDSSGDPPSVRLQLSWTGSSYEWTGAAVQLSTC